MRRRALLVTGNLWRTLQRRVETSACGSVPGRLNPCLRASTASDTSSEAAGTSTRATSAPPHEDPQRSQDAIAVDGGLLKTLKGVRGAGGSCTFDWISPCRGEHRSRKNAMILVWSRRSYTSARPTSPTTLAPSILVRRSESERVSGDSQRHRPADPNSHSAVWRLRSQVVGCRGSPDCLSVHSEARSRSRAKASASLSRSIISAEILPILRSRRTVGGDPNP